MGNHCSSRFYRLVLNTVTLGTLDVSQSYCRICQSNRHVIMPLYESGKNINFCCHVRRVVIWNSNYDDVITTASGLRIKLNDKGLTTVAKAKAGFGNSAFKLAFRDEFQYCDINTKCERACCSFCNCFEMVEYRPLIPDVAYIEGDLTESACGTLCSAISGKLFPCLTCCGLVEYCERTVRIEMDEYELVDFGGNFIDYDALPSHHREPPSKRVASPRNGVMPPALTAAATAAATSSSVVVPSITITPPQQQPATSSETITINVRDS